MPRFPKPITYSMAPKKVIPTYAAVSGLDSPLTVPEDATLTNISSVNDAKIVKPPGVTTLRQWGDQVLGGGKHAGKTFAQVLAIDASYVEFMKRKGDCTSAWALSFHNYVLATARMETTMPVESQQPVLTPQMIKKTREEWAQQGATATDWDVIDDLNSYHRSEVPVGIPSMASGSAPGKRGVPLLEDHQKMQVDLAKENRDRVTQIQTQIAILQRELAFLMPAEES